MIATAWMERVMGAWKIDRLSSFSATVSAFLDGTDSPRAFLERCLAVIAAREPEVKAFVTLNADGARAAADASSERYRDGRPLSPVDGCPVGVKDVIETADMPTQMNSPLYRGWNSGRDAACVRALRKGGAIILGKTVTAELEAGRSGPTTNPFDPARTPGGSSSGSAAAVGAGMLPVALGTQGGGSTIRPASYCGVWGFKPSHGALSLAGVHIVSATCDHLGILASGLADAWRVARQISEGAHTPDCHGLPGTGHQAPPPARPRRLIRLYTKGWEEIVDAGGAARNGLGEEVEASRDEAALRAATRAAFEERIDRLRAAGVDILSRDNDADMAALEGELDNGVGGRLDIVAFEMRWPFDEYLDWHGADVGQSIHGYMQRGSRLTPTDYRRLLDLRARARRRVMEFAGRADGFVTLASTGPAPIGLAFTGSRTFLNYWSWLGFPAFSMPLLEVGGLPVGLQLMGFDRQDDRLAATAAWLAETPT
ncbi:MAG: amidase [Proteobacteria bacterium]|nr:amidase [Pseudomonadota bacterium]